MGIKMDDVRAFVATVHCQSLTRAAEVLGIPQSAVTRRVQSLEETLNAALLNRDTRPPKPSALGWRVFEKCQILLRESEELQSLISEDGMPQGIFRLGVPQTIAEVGLSLILDKLQRSFPALNVQVMTRWSPDLLKMVASGELHAATVIFPTTQSFPETVQAEPLMLMDLIVVCAKGAMPGRKKPYALTDLKDIGWVLNPEGCRFRACLQQATQEIGSPLHIVSDALGTDLQLRLVAENAGLGLVPREFLESSQYRDSIDILPLSDFKLSADLWLIKCIAPGNLSSPIEIFGKSVANSLADLESDARHRLPSSARTKGKSSKRNNSAPSLTHAGRIRRPTAASLKTASGGVKNSKGGGRITPLRGR